MRTLAAFVLFITALNAASDLEGARDRQDKPALEKAIADLSAAAAKQPQDASTQFRLATAQSLRAEIAIEMHDKGLAKNAAVSGIKAAERAVALQPSVADHHRVLGTLCGQVIPANVLLGMQYGRCAQDSINKAIELDPKNAMAYVSRGVGNYYLPEGFGGGVELAMKDFNKAIQLNPKLPEAYLWLGVALRKAKRD